MTMAREHDIREVAKGMSSEDLEAFLREVPAELLLAELSDRIKSYEEAILYARAALNGGYIDGKENESTAVR